MHAGVVVRFPKRSPIYASLGTLIVIIGMLIGFPALAQKTKPRPKTPAPASDAAAPTPGAQTSAEHPAAVPAESTASARGEQAGSTSEEPAPPRPAQRANASRPKPAVPAVTKSDAPASSEPAVPAPTEQPAPATPPLAPPANTQAEPVATAALASIPGSGWAELVKTVGGVGLVICLILAGYLLFRRFAPQYVVKRPNERLLRLIETLPLGDKRSIVMMQAGAKKFLLASTPGHITLLTSLPDAAVPDSLSPSGQAEAEVPAHQAGNFRNLYELEKKSPPARPAVRQELPPDIRGKMQQLRKALEG